MTAPDPWADWTDVPLPLELAPEPLEETDDPLETETVERYLPAVLAEDAALAVEDWRDPQVAHTFAADLRRQFLGHVRDQYAPLLAARPAGRLTPAAVGPELAFCTSVANAADEVAAAIRAGADEARAIAGEVLVDLADGEERKTSTAKVADVFGEIRATRSQAMKPSVLQDEVLDVLVASLLTIPGEDDETLNHPAVAEALRQRARGARDALDALLGLVGPLAWKKTAVGALARNLSERGEDALAIRLETAVGEKPVGEPKVKLERVPAKDDK